MNQRCYRLIFNRTRGQVMAVAETARSHGAGGGRMLFAGLPLVALLVWSLLPAVGNAQIIPDRSALPERQPVINHAPNGVPLVNIQTPNPAGVSRNAYSQFDVQQNGAILNNATQAVQTSLGGWVQANPLLNRSASVIVNEVHSSDPSLLRGYVEVAGQRAQLIIANPSGISCDGCGFINAYRATVTTGVPQYGINGTLDSYLVRGGAVRFAGDGLDASSVDFTDVIARAVQANAALRARSLRVIAGSNDVQADTLHATPVAGSEGPPEFAIDVGALGGMYARKIWLVATEAGVGVRHAGTIGGGAGEIHVTAAGRLEVTGLIDSAGALTVTAAQGLDNHGTLHAATEAALQVAGVLDNRGGMIAADGLLSVTDAGSGERTLAITNTGGTLVAGQRVAIDAARLSGDGQVLGETDVDIQLTSDYDHTGALAANRHLHLTTTGTVNNHAAITAGDTLDVTADKINNEADGTLEAPTLTLTATAPHALINRGQIDGSDVLLKSTTIKNLGTGRVYGDHLMLDADIVLNDAEANASPVIAARTRLDIAANQVINREAALIYSDGELAIGRHLDGDGHATGQAWLLENTSATIEAQGDMALAVDEVFNRNAHYSTRGETRPAETVVELAGSGSPNRYAPEAPGVYVYNDESDHLHTPEGNYERWLRYDYQRSVTEEVTATSSPAQIVAGGNLRVRGLVLTNDKSRVLAGQDLDVQAATVNNLDATGTRTISDSGTVTSFWRDHEKGRDRTGVTRAAYEPPPVMQAVSLGVVAYRDHATPEPAGIVDVGGGGQAIRTVSLAASVPAGSLYRVAPEARGYLVETDPRFANYRQWLASDYLLQRLALDPQQMNKRLGDGFYEQKLVREQVAQLTGRRFLPGYANDEAQFQALMDSGATFAQAHQLRPGVALSAEQMAALTSDIVWLVEKDVTLPDGQVTRALVPQVYVQVRDGDLKPDGTLLGGEQVRLTLTGDLNNGGTIAGRQVVALNAANVKNVGGTIAGGSVNVNAAADIDGTGGQLRAGKALLLTAGKDITVASTTRSQSAAQGSRTNVERVAGLYVSREDGQMVVVAGHDLNLKGAVLRQGPPAAIDSVTNAATTTTTGTAATTAVPATGRIVLAAGNDIRLDTVTDTRSERVDWGGGNHRSEASRTEVATTIDASGAIDLAAGRDLVSRGAQVTTRDGAINATATRDVTLTTAESQASVDESHRHTSSGFLSSTTYAYRDTLEQTTQRGTLLSGHQVSVQAGQDTSVTGSNVVSSAGTVVGAGRNVSIDATTDTRHETHRRQKKSSGLMGSGGFGVTIGTRSLKTNSDTTASTAVASTVGSTQGDVTIAAGDTVRQSGSAVLAPQGNVTMAGRKVDIQDARNTETTITDTQFRQSGLTVALSNPVVSAVQTAEQMVDAASNTKDGRMKALAAANTAMAAANAYGAVKAGQGTTINGKANQISTGKDAAGNETSRDANAADPMGGIQVSISVGSSKSDSHTVATRSEAAASSVGAGGNVTIAATGDTQHSDVTVQGSQLAAGQQLTLVADHAVNLQAAANTESQQSSNRSSSASVGVVMDTKGGFGVNASGSLGRGHADGSDLGWTNAKVTGGEQVTLQSGADTTIRGAVVAAPQVTVASGGQLVIESLQDSSTYKSSQQQVGGSVTIGTAPSANLNYAKGKVDSTYASVAEQSGLRAGDGGFTVTVAGDTTLKGGAITSTQAAIDAQRNTFSTTGTLTATDIDNHARYEAESVSVNVGTGFSAQGALAPMGTGVGFGRDSDRASSTTTSGISDVAGDQSLRTGDPATGIAKIFDAERVQKEVTAQTQITQMFSTLAPRQVASYAGGKVSEINEQLGQETDPDRRADLLGEKAKWEEGGAYRVAMHTAVGGLVGNVSGAAGAGAAAMAAPKLNEMQANLEASLQKAGMNPTVAKGVAANASGLAAAGIGGAVGGATGAGVGMSVDANNRQLHPVEKTRIKQLSAGDAKKEARLTAAACAMVKCYAEYPVDSQAYQQLKQLAEIGAGDALSNERQLLAQQTGMFAYSTDGLLSDTNKDALKQVNNTYQLTTRAFGAGQATLGGLGFAASVASAPVTCATGAGCVANAVVATASLDALQAGSKQVVSGNPENTHLNQGLQGLGMSPEAALIVETVLSVGATVQAGKVFYQSVDRSIEISKLSSASYENFIANGVRVTPEVMQMPQAQALMKEVRGSFPNLTDQQIKGIVANYIESGSNLPQMEIAGQGSVLIKVVPKGTDISPTSGYWMTVQQARAIAALEPAQIGNILGLPAGQAANAMRDGVEFYAITPKSGVSPKIFFSEVANTNQGRVAMNGGAQQVIVPNRENWTNPTRVDPFNLHPVRGK